MNIGTAISILVFVLTAIGISSLVYRLTRRVLGTVIISATATVVLYQAIGILVVGYLDPFFLIAVVIGWPIAFAICGITILIIKKPSLKQNDPSGLKKM
jgi:hypothetical protein